MDLIRILRERIEALEPGDHTAGLRAVLQHVQVASRHLSRGSKGGDDAAFTDAIYRTNQAFEGSLKEAYRVLTGDDPARVRPYDIESHFQTHGQLRSRVLKQFTTYRTEWRNPATHDYKLDFDEDEALLAIVSVCAFAIVLIDQIQEKLSFDKARQDTPTSPIAPAESNIVDLVANALLEFRLMSTSPGAIPREAELTAALAGYLAARIPTATTETNVKVNEEVEADILVRDVRGPLLIEVKRSPGSLRHLDEQIEQLRRYASVAGISDAVLYVFGGDDATMAKDEHPWIGAGRLIIVRPQPHRSKPPVSPR